MGLHPIGKLMTVTFSSRGFYGGARRRLPDLWAKALRALAEQSQMTPEDFAMQMLEVALIEQFERRAGMTITDWFSARKPACLDNSAGRNDAREPLAIGLPASATAP